MTTGGSIYTVDAFTGDKELSLPKSQRPDLLKKVRDDYLKGAQKLPEQVNNPKKE